jgi:Flp pilus assembly protein TadD
MTPIAVRDEPTVLAPSTAPASWSFLAQLGVQAEGDQHSVSSAFPNEESEAERLLRLFPNSQTAMARLAREQLELGKMEASIRTASTIVRDTGARDDSALVAALQTLMMAGAWQIVEEYFDARDYSLQASEPLPAIAKLMQVDLMVRRGETERALGLLNSINEPLANVSAAKAALLLTSGRHDQALHQLRAAIAIGPASPALFVNLGYALAFHGAQRKAIRATQTALHLAPADKRARINLVGLYLACGEPLKAEALFRDLGGSRDPELTLAWVSVRMQTGDDQGALTLLNAALNGVDTRRELNPPVAELAAAREIARYRLHRESLSELREELLRLARLASPPSAGVSQHVASTTHDSEGVASLLDVRGRLEASGGDAGAIAALDVQIAALSGEWERAAERSRDWVKREPFNANAAISATYMIGMGVGRLHEAITLGEQSLRRFPGNPMLSNNVAFAKVLVGDVKGAERCLGAGGDQPLKPATLGLIALAKGDVGGASALYREGVVRADQRDPGLRASIDLYEQIGTYWFAGGDPPSFSSLSDKVRKDLRVSVVQRAWNAWMQGRAALDTPA